MSKYSIEDDGDCISVIMNEDSSCYLASFYYFEDPDGSPFRFRQERAIKLAQDLADKLNVDETMYVKLLE